jgi:microcompartment protein CcmL/EutN
LAEANVRTGGKALGIVEAQGLSPAIFCADTALKAADVELIGYEFAKGMGRITVKLCGNIGSVQAAVGAAKALLEREGKYVASSVIPRPAPEAEPWISQVDRAPAENRPPAAAPGKTAVAAAADDKPAGELCNLCEDPACPRRKGDPHGDCIHFAEPVK